MLFQRHLLAVILLPMILAFVGLCQAQELADTIRIPAKGIVFFGPTEAERDSLNQREDSGIEEVMADFLFYVGKIRPFLDSNGISLYETTARKIVIIGAKPFSYGRASPGAVVGLILEQNGKPPKVLEGVSTDVDLQQICTEYFNLRSNTPRLKKR